LFKIIQKAFDDADEREKLVIFDKANELISCISKAEEREKQKKAENLLREKADLLKRIKEIEEEEKQLK